MTHTAEPMTLADVSRKLNDFANYPDDESPMRGELQALADAIDAELAKQREAGPMEVTDELVQVAAKAICKWAGDDPDGTEGVLEYRQVDQQTIVNKVPNWYGYADYARAALSAVASRDREDAERYHHLAKIVRWEDERDMGPGGRYWISIMVDKGKPTFQEAVDAARRENKS